MPLTKDLKIDYTQLPQPGHRRPPLPHAYVAPRTVFEQELVRIWGDVLDIRPIGIRDNFFDLGGHSLLAVWLCAQIQKRMGKNLPVAVLFHAPTIEQLARLMDRQIVVHSMEVIGSDSAGGWEGTVFLFSCPHDGGVLFPPHLFSHLNSDKPFWRGCRFQAMEGGGALLRELV